METDKEPENTVPDGPTAVFWSVKVGLFREMLTPLNHAFHNIEIYSYRIKTFRKSKKHLT